MTLLSEGEYLEPFSFDTSSARYLLHTGSIDLSTDSLKKAFRKSPKSEVLAMHVMRDRVALEGQINAIVVHLDFFGQGTNPHGYYRDEGGAETRQKAGELIVLDLSLRHLLVISKVSKLMGTPVCMAMERASDQGAFCFLVTSAKHFCFCLGFTVSATFGHLRLDSNTYISRIDRQLQDKQ